MKQFLKYLYNKNKRDFEVWNYLWLFSDNNRIEFTHADLCSLFDVPPSSLYRIIHSNIDFLNTDSKIFIEYNRIEYKTYRVTFYVKGKAVKEDKSSIHEEIYLWLKDYYASLDFDYENLSTQKRFISTICKKLEKVMSLKNNDIDDETLKNTFYFFMMNIDDWWKNTGNITLPILSKHFTKILNQIKSNDARKKSDSYSKSANQIDSIDFTKLTRK